MDEIFVVIKEKQPIISLEELSGGDCIPWIKQKGLERLTRFLVLMNNSSNIIGGGPYSQEECELLLIVYFSNEKENPISEATLMCFIPSREAVRFIFPLFC